MTWFQTLWQIKKFQAIIKKLFIRCRKLNISLVFITQSHISVPKNVRLNSTHYLFMKINSEKELQNISIDHFADTDYNYFVKIYRECTKRNLFFFDSWYYFTCYWSFINLEKICFILIKMTVVDQIKIWDRKIKQNKAQYDLDSKAAKISALSSGNVDKYEYLTSEDLQPFS